MKHTVASDANPKFKPITLAITFETAAEVKAFLSFHTGQAPEDDGLSADAYRALELAAEKQGIRV